jgi:hypothetical protein
VLGKDFLQQYNGEVDGDALHLVSGDGEGGLAYGLYQLQGLAGKKPQTLSVENTPGAEGEYFVGLANYSTQNWQWFGPFHLPEAEIRLGESEDRYITELGNFYFLILVKHGQSSTHHQTTLSYGESTGEGERPAAPFELRASDGEYPSSVKVNWAGGQGADFFEVWRRLDQAHGEDEAWVKIGTTEGHEFFDNEVEANVWYRYKARAVNGVGSSDYSNVDKGYAGFNDDDWCPNELVASDGTSADWVELHWNRGSGDGGMFNIWRRPDGGGDFEKIGTTDDTLYHDTTAEPGVWYIYKVQRVMEDQSCSSNTDAGFRSSEGGDGWCPSELWASDGTYGGGVKLEWVGGEGDGTFDIYRKVAETENAFQLIEDGLTVTSFFDETAETGVVYAYKVFKRLGEEQCGTNIDTGYRGQEGSGEWCPSELGASDGTYEAGVKIEWYGGDGAGVFDVFRKVAETEGEFTLVEDGLTATNFFDETAETGVVYVYKVRKRAEGHEACFTNIDSGYRGEGVGDDWCPTGLVATDGLYADYVRVEWNGGTGDGFFTVWRKRDGEGFQWINRGNTEDESYNDMDVDTGVVYIYKVVKHSGENECASNTDSGYASVD